MIRSAPLLAEDTLTLLIRSLGVNTWSELIDYIKHIPYGRTSDRGNVQLVITENQGTCSSKHALLKSMADQNNIPGVNLILGMYRMTSVNTPKIGDTLTKAHLAYIPEAHCYLKIDNDRYDFTFPNSSIDTIKSDILEETEIGPEDIGDYKVRHHRRFLESWLERENISIPLEQLWKIREQCIFNLSK